MEHVMNRGQIRWTEAHLNESLPHDEVEEDLLSIKLLATLCRPIGSLTTKGKF
jgi:hypothetical protein